MNRLTNDIRIVRAVLVAAAILVVSAIAGCGSDSDDASTGGGQLKGARAVWGEPAGPPKGVVMLIHGGGWQRSENDFDEQKASAPSVQDLGYATVAIGYDEGAKGFEQIVAVYKEARKRYPDLPICASGISAGGHLALMLATREPDLACVLTLAAPTDLTTIAKQDPEDQEAYEKAVVAFGQDQLAKFSPVRYADQIKAKVLMIIAATDPLVPVAQGDEMTKALPGAELIVLPPGPVQVPFAHYGGVQPDAQNVVIKAEVDFLAEATEGN